MIHITKEQEPLYLELKQIQKQMRQAAQQAKVYQNSCMILTRTIKKNELTIKQLQKVPEDRGIFVPLGKAFLRRDKNTTIKEMISASEKLSQSITQMQKNQKSFAQKANQKYALLKEGTERLTKKQ